MGHGQALETYAGEIIPIPDLADFSTQQDYKLVGVLILLRHLSLH